MGEEEKLDLFERLWKRLCIIQGPNGLKKEDAFTAFDEIYRWGFNSGYVEGCSRNQGD